jgi:hypothetical protein
MALLRHIKDGGGSSGNDDWFAEEAAKDAEEGGSIAQLPENPTDEDREAAMKRLEELVKDGVSGLALSPDDKWELSD